MEVPAGAVWSSDFDLDNYNVAPGKTLELAPTDALTYSTKWADGENRQVTILATAQDPYTVMTSGVEAEGSYVWNYTSVDPAVLPRNASYTLSYTITTNGVPIAVEQAESTIKLTPEPALFFLAILAVLFGVRKMRSGLAVVPVLLLTIMTFSASADVVSGITCRQRWPWNGKVDIDYTLNSSSAGAVFSVQFFGKIGDGEAFNLSTIEGEGQYGIVFGSGQKRVTWDSTKQLGHTVDSSEAKVAIFAEDVTGDATYIVFDLTNNSVGFTTTAPSAAAGAISKLSQVWFRRVEAGTFVMGSNSSEPYHEDYAASEVEHTVTITKPFYMGVFEFTQKQFETIAGYNPVQMWAYIGDTKPVENVSYDDLRGENVGATWPTYTDYRVDATSFFGVFRARFGNQFIFDLPTDAQWEMACRDKGTSDRTTSGFWGSGVWNDGSAILGTNPDANLDNLANYDGDSSVVPHEVGTKTPNFIGLYDMHGNVDEMCLDIWAQDISSYTVDPVGPASAWNLFRVIRSGDCTTDPDACRAAYRSFITPSNRLTQDGFRAVLIP
ncbi:formylglycine-generating enzyme family protein [bacterium]|nr:formylglycine-generating enzyme family protein [bacterium]